MAKKNGVNRSEKVREYLSEHPHAGTSEVVEALKQYDVSPALVYQIKKKSGTGGRKKVRKKRAAKAAPKRATARTAARRRGPNRQPAQAEPIIAAAELIRMCGGVEEAKAVLETAGRVAAVLKQLELQL